MGVLSIPLKCFQDGSGKKVAVSHNSLTDCIPVSVVVLSGRPFPAAGEHVETLQATLQAADQARTQQGPAGRGKGLLLFPIH